MQLDILFSKISFLLPKKWHWVLEHEGFKKYFANTGWMFFGQMFSLVISFFIGVWLARYLGPENYGIISYAVTFASLFSFIAYLGVHNVLLRELTQFPEKKDKLLGTSFFLLLAGGVITFCLVVIFSFFLETSSFNRGLIILYATTFLWSAFGVISIFFQATVQAKKNVKAAVISAFITSILKVVLILTKQGIIWLMLIYVTESLILTGLYVINYLKSGFKISSWNIDKKLIKQILSGSIFLALASAASFIFLRVDQVMIRKILDETAVGFYAAAIKFVEIWYFIPGIICASLFPAIMNAKKTDEKKYKNRLKNLYLLLSGLAIIIAIFIYFSASWIIKLLLGEIYLNSIEILKIYAWSGIGFFLNVGFYQYFLAENRLKTIFYFYFILMVLNICLNYIFINKIGLNGAAWATMISYSLGVIIFLGLKFFYFEKVS